MPGGPRPLPWAQQLVVVDYQRTHGQSSPAAGGTCSVELGPVPQDETWLVDRMIVLCDSAADTEARVYVGSVRDTAFVDGSLTGNLDVADESQPVLVDAGEPLTCVWSGAADGAVGTFAIQYRLVERRGAFVEP